MVLKPKIQYTLKHKHIKPIENNKALCFPSDSIAKHISFFTRHIKHSPPSKSIRHKHQKQVKR